MTEYEPLWLYESQAFRNKVYTDNVTTTNELHKYNFYLTAVIYWIIIGIIIPSLFLHEFQKYVYSLISNPSTLLKQAIFEIIQSRIWKVFTEISSLARREKLLLVLFAIYRRLNWRPAASLRNIGGNEINLHFILYEVLIAPRTWTDNIIYRENKKEFRVSPKQAYIVTKIRWTLDMPTFSVSA